MSATKATALVPTHEHGPLLGFAVRSALAQTVEEIEVFIVCDGATDDTLEAAEELSNLDDRVRLFVHDKGPRHGEVYRHRALQEANGDIVCYLSDDDLWLPDHVATMARLLESANFAHAYPMGLGIDGRPFSWPGHLSLAEVRQSLLEGRNFIPLSCGAHTLEFYRRLPYGWRTAPADTHSDLYMWQQILSVDGVRVASGGEATVLHFPSSHRVDMSIEERVDELARWAAATTTPDFTADLHRRIRENLVVEWARSAVRQGALTQQVTDTRDRLAILEADLGAAKAELARVNTRLTDELDKSVRDAEHVEQVEERISKLQDELGWMSNSRTWRLRASVLGIPGVARLVRRAGIARSR